MIRAAQGRFMILLSYTSGPVPSGQNCTIFNCFRSRLRVRHDVEEGAVHGQFAIVVNEAQLPELFKKKLIRDRRVPTISTSVPADLRNDGLGLAFFYNRRTLTSASVLSQTMPRCFSACLSPSLILYVTHLLECSRCPVPARLSVVRPVRVSPLPFAGAQDGSVGW